METSHLHLGRLIDHVGLVVRDLGASRRFYAAVAGALGVPMGPSGADFFSIDELYVSTADSSVVAGQLTGRVHLAFQARDRATVVRFHAEGLRAGGTDNGGPGERAYHPGYYAAFLLDPDGNNVEAVYHGPSERSARSVEVSFPE
jgi:catechol 2,3-dioxygenase-like lactoylglutathione lyase family enzyme